MVSDKGLDNPFDDNTSDGVEFIDDVSGDAIEVGTISLVVV